MKRAALLAAALAFPAAPRAAEPGANLVLFEDKGCAWCMHWEREVGTVYAKTDEGRRLPLRRVPIRAPRPADLAPIEGVYATPTFVVIACGAEVGRILGYSGEASFYGLLGELIERLDARTC